jgi:hypothetical protein
MTQVTEVREVTEVQEAEKAPTNERPSQVNDTATDATAQAHVDLDDLNQLLRTVLPHADIEWQIHVHQSWRDGYRRPRSLTEAHRLAETIVSEHGGQIEIRPFRDSRTPAGGTVAVLLSRNTVVNVYYEDRFEEA